MKNQTRNFYACQSIFKEGKENIQMFGKTVFVFKTLQARNDFLIGKCEKEFFVISQKEAYKLCNIKKSSEGVVYRHTQFIQNFVLASPRQCWGSQHILLNQYNENIDYA